ncbi:Esa1p-associated factor [Mitosporidium daphniae]
MVCYNYISHKIPCLSLITVHILIPFCTTDFLSVIDSLISHFRGRWNEWVGPGRIMKLNEENIAKMKNLKKMHFERGGQEVDMSSPTAESPPVLPKRRLTQTGLQTSRKKPPSEDAKAEHDSTETSAQTTLIEMKIPIPNNLKAVLVDDFEAITKNQMVLKTPATPTLSQVLAMYLEDQYPEDGTCTQQREVAREVCEGLCDYFNVALGSFLLYPFERVQLKDVLKTSEAAPLSQIYGAIHLLRLFVKIPSLLSQTATTISTSAVLRDEFIKILQFLDQKHDTLFPDSIYEFAEPSYISRSKGLLM